jgi:hypothetical protein
MLPAHAETHSQSRGRHPTNTTGRVHGAHMCVRKAENTVHMARAGVCVPMHGNRCPNTREVALFECEAAWSILDSVARKA